MNQGLFLSAELRPRFHNTVRSREICIQRLFEYFSPGNISASDGGDVFVMRYIWLLGLLALLFVQPAFAEAGNASVMTHAMEMTTMNGCQGADDGSACQQTCCQLSQASILHSCHSLIQLQAVSYPTITSPQPGHLPADIFHPPILFS
ncbi:hypothetical Protein YC6258_00345 [Gynuella sunshinyii YC6258]|uniref:Uncharacterized protein n=2 Tax=Gynuella sunshinyii TaxID=1445505 RepID=A0A0C5UYL8_9GAMM|nr:hypothetical Protein YC6258_00345 [Gynuella sunshinyii YC6258]